MTDLESRPNLAEYEQLLADLEKEIEIYKAQRTSLAAVVTSLRAIEAANDRTAEQIAAVIGAGEQVFARLEQLDLPNQIANLESRYNQHQQSLSDVTTKMQQIVQEQQRGSLEALQNAQHAREALDRQEKTAQAAAEAQEAKIAGVADQLTSLGDGLAGKVDQVLPALQAQNESLEEVKRQLAVTRMIAIVTLVVLLAFALATALNIM